MKIPGASRLASVPLLAIAAIATTSCLPAQEGTKTKSGRAVKKRVLQPGDIDLQASRVYIFVDKTGFGHQHAVVGKLKGGTLTAGDPPAGRMVFDVRSFVADTDAARRYTSLEGDIAEKTQKQVTESMLGADVLDAEHFPTATFEVNLLKPLGTKGESGAPQHRLKGEFTLHGVTQPLEITVDGTDEKGYLHLQGSFQLLQTDYKIRPFKKALGAVGVKDELRVYGDIWVKK